MRPRLLPTLALCSLACCLLLATLCVRSYGRMILTGYTNTSAATVHVDCSNGSLGLGVQRGAPRPAGFFWITQPYGRVDLRAVLGSLTRFGCYRGTMPDGTTVVAVTLPAWLPTAVTLVPPAIWWRRRRKIARGFPVEVPQDA